MAAGKIKSIVVGIAWFLVSPQLCLADGVTALDIYVAAEAANAEEYTEEAPRRQPVRIQKTVLSEMALRKAARKIAAEYGIPPRLYEAVIEFESGFKFARGSSGEHGLAQVMPGTGQMLAARGQVKNNWWYDPIENLRAGAVHLKNLKGSLTRKEIEYARRKKYNLWAVLLAQYNGGKSGVGKSVCADARLPYRLEWYIYNVLKRYNKLEG